MAFSAADLGRKLESAGQKIPAAAREGVAVAALNIKTGWLGIAASHGMPPGRKLRGVGRRGAPWNVRYDIQGTANPTALIRFTGPVHLVLHPVKPHTILPKKAARTRKARSAKGAGITAVLGLTGASALGRGGLGGGRGAVVIAGQPRAYAQHPGTRGKTEVWPECRAYAMRVGPASFEPSVTGALLRAGLNR